MTDARNSFGHIPLRFFRLAAMMAEVARNTHKSRGSIRLQKLAQWRQALAAWKQPSKGPGSSEDQQADRHYFFLRSHDQFRFR
jgi:hypothetical protein